MLLKLSAATRGRWSMCERLSRCGVGDSTVVKEVRYFRKFAVALPIQGRVWGRARKAAAAEKYPGRKLGI